MDVSHMDNLHSLKHLHKHVEDLDGGMESIKKHIEILLAIGEHKRIQMHPSQLEDQI